MNIFIELLLVAAGCFAGKQLLVKWGDIRCLLNSIKMRSPGYRGNALPW